MDKLYQSTEHLTDEVIKAFWMDELTKHEESEINTHVIECSECRKATDDYYHDWRNPNVKKEKRRQRQKYGRENLGKILSDFFKKL